MVIRPGRPPCLGLALELFLDPVPSLRVDDLRMKAPFAGSDQRDGQKDRRQPDLPRPPLLYPVNPIYVGRLRHKGQFHDGLHPAIVDPETWDRVQDKDYRTTTSTAAEAASPKGVRAWIV